MLLHGGPGGSSALLEPLDELAATGRRVVRFDQLGSGLSDRPRSPSYWGVAACLEQIDAVRAAFGLERLHIVGHSWGAMLALEYLLAGAHGVASVSLCSGLGSVPLWVQECRRLRRALPAHVQSGLERCERSFAARALPPADAPDAGRLSAERIARDARMLAAVVPIASSGAVSRLASWLSHVRPMRGLAYELLATTFVRRHVCRADPIPDGVLRFIAGMNKELYEVLWGPSEFSAPGLLRDWNVFPRLAELDVPTLVLSGEHDEATPEHMRELASAIRGARQKVLDGCSHCGMWERPDAYRAELISFIDRVDGRD